MQDLFAHQKEFLSTRVDRTALVWSCGTGKTRTACEWSLQVPLAAVVVCPKPLKKNWEREAKKWMTNIAVYTKEEFRSMVQKGIMPKYGQIIVDEVHNGFLTPHFKSQMSKALRTYIKTHKISRVLLLSATVYTSSPWNVFQLAMFLGHKWNWLEFNFTFFDQVRMSGRIVPVAKKKMDKRLALALKKIASTVDINDCIDVPEQLHTEPEYFVLSKEQEQAIKDTWDAHHLVRATKKHEIENGVLIGDENGLVKDRFFETDKMARLDELIRENKKIAIVCRYNLQIDAIAQYIEHAFAERDCFIIRGATKDRDGITLLAEEREEAIVIIQADCAEGYQLPSFELCVFASMSYSYAKWDQICGRFLRQDKPSRTTFIYLLTDGKSVDQAVYDAIQLKQDFKEHLYG